MSKAISIFLAVVLIGLTANIANADSLGVTLRYWLTEEHNANARIRPRFAVVPEDYKVDVPGLTLRWSPDFWEKHDILLSYYQIDRERAASVLIVPTDGSGVGETGIEDLGNERSDIELLARTRVNEHVFLYYGLRQIKQVSREEGTGILFNVESKSEENWTLAEVGLGLAASISENGRHNLFANALLAVGTIEGETSFFDSDAGEFVEENHPRRDARTTDLNLGYQYTLNPTLSFSLRYRDLSTYRDSELRLRTAGIDLGVSFNF